MANNVNLELLSAINKKLENMNIDNNKTISPETIVNVFEKLTNTLMTTNDVNEKILSLCLKYGVNNTNTNKYNEYGNYDQRSNYIHSATRNYSRIDNREQMNFSKYTDNNFYNKISNNVTNMFKTIKNSILSPFKNLYNSIMSPFKSIKNGIKSLFSPNKDNNSENSVIQGKRESNEDFNHRIAGIAKKQLRENVVMKRSAVGVAVEWLWKKLKDRMPQSSIFGGLWSFLGDLLGSLLGLGLLGWLFKKLKKEKDDDDKNNKQNGIKQPVTSNVRQTEFDFYKQLAEEKKVFNAQLGKAPMILPMPSPDSNRAKEPLAAVTPNELPDLQSSYIRLPDTQPSIDNVRWGSRFMDKKEEIQPPTIPASSVDNIWAGMDQYSSPMYTLIKSIVSSIPVPKIELPTLPNIDKQLDSIRSATNSVDNKMQEFTKIGIEKTTALATTAGAILSEIMKYRRIENQASPVGPDMWDGIPELIDNTNASMKAQVDMWDGVPELIDNINASVKAQPDYNHIPIDIIKSLDTSLISKTITDIKAAIVNMLPDFSRILDVVTQIISFIPKIPYKDNIPDIVKNPNLAQTAPSLSSSTPKAGALGFSMSDLRKDLKIKPADTIDITAQLFAAGAFIPIILNVFRAMSTVLSGGSAGLVFSFISVLAAVFSRALPAGAKEQNTQNMYFLPYGSRIPSSNSSGGGSYYTGGGSGSGKKPIGKPEIFSPQSLKIDVSDSLVDVAGKVISQNEGGYGSVNADDGGVGASLGKLQWNRGRARNLLKMMYEEDPELFKSTMGDRITDSINDKSKWEIQKGDPNRMIFSSEDKKNFKELMKDTRMIGVQDKLFKSYVADYLMSAQKHGIKDPKAQIYYADLINQYGFGGAQKFIKFLPEDQRTLQNIFNASSSEYSNRRYRTYSTINGLDIPANMSNDISMKGDKIQNKQLTEEMVKSNQQTSSVFMKQTVESQKNIDQSINKIASSIDGIPKAISNSTKTTQSATPSNNMDIPPSSENIPKYVLEYMFGLNIGGNEGITLT